MNHLDDFTLNEYLDEALDESSRQDVETHLASCPDCRIRLEDLQAVFAELEALPETTLAHNLTLSVLARLPQTMPARAVVWTRAFAAQLGVALGAFIWLAMQVVNFVRIPQISMPELPAFDIQLLLAQLFSFRFTMPDFQLAPLTTTPVPCA